MEIKVRTNTNKFTRASGFPTRVVTGTKSFTETQHKQQGVKVRTTHRCYVDVFLHAIGVAQGEVACDAQAGRSQVKGHGDGGPFLLHLNVSGVPVYRQSRKRKWRKEVYRTTFNPKKHRCSSLY